MYKWAICVLAILVCASTGYCAGNVRSWKCSAGQPLPFVKISGMEGLTALTKNMDGSYEIVISPDSNPGTSVKIPGNQSYIVGTKTKRHIFLIDYPRWRNIYLWGERYDLLVDHVNVSIDWRMGEGGQFYSSVSGDYKGEMHVEPFRVETGMTEEYSATWTECADPNIVVWSDGQTPANRMFEVRYASSAGATTHAETKYDNLRSAYLLTGGMNRMYFVGGEQIEKTDGQGLDKSKLTTTMVVGAAKIERSDEQKNLSKLTLNTNMSTDQAKEAINSASPTGALLSLVNKLIDDVVIRWSITATLFSDETRTVDGEVLKTTPFSEGTSAHGYVYPRSDASSWKLCANSVAALDWATGGHYDNGGHPVDGYVLRGSGHAWTEMFQVTKVQTLRP